MVGLLLTGSILTSVTFLYCGLVLAKRCDNTIYKEKERLNWKK